MEGARGWGLAECLVSDPGALLTPRGADLCHSHNYVQCLAYWVDTGQRLGPPDAELRGNGNARWPSVRSVRPLTYNVQLWVRKGRTWIVHHGAADRCG
jgi:hypothetical protein